MIKNTHFNPLILTLYLHKVLLTHSHPGAKLLISLTLNSEKTLHFPTYKAQKEILIADSVSFPLEGLSIEETLLKLEVFLIANNKGISLNKLIGIYYMKLKSIYNRENGQIDENQRVLIDETTERTYQPKVFLHFNAESPEIGVEEGNCSPTFNTNPQKEDILNTNPLYFEEKPFVNNGSIEVSIDNGNKGLSIEINHSFENDHSIEENDYKLNEFKPKLTRSETPKPIKSPDNSFINSLAIGYIALLKRRNYSQNLFLSPQKKKAPLKLLYNGPLSSRNECDYNKQREEKTKKKGFSPNPSPQLDSFIQENIDPREINCQEEVYTKENEKIKENNENLINQLKNTHLELISTEVPPFDISKSSFLDNKAKLSLQNPEIVLLEKANLELKQALFAKNEAFILKKRELAEIFIEISSKQKAITQYNEEISLKKTEFGLLKTPDPHKGLLQRKNLLQRELAKIEEDFKKSFLEYETKLSKEKVRYKGLEELFEANQEENELLNEVSTGEKELLKERLKELGVFRDSMRKNLLIKDERILELERNIKAMSLLIVKLKEEKARAINCIFENEMPEILLEME